MGRIGRFVGTHWKMVVVAILGVVAGSASVPQEIAGIARLALTWLVGAGG